MACCRPASANFLAETLQGFGLLSQHSRASKTDAIMLGLMLGGRRPSQLLRVRLVDLDLSAGTLKRKDPKGARQQPRVHVLPLTAAATAICKRLAERSVSLAEEDLKGPSPMLFTSDGKRPLRIETVSAVVTAIVDAMMKARELRERFEMRDLRRTCETMLAAMGVSSDVRARRQSRGVDEVQTRHYGRHSYMDGFVPIFQVHRYQFVERCFSLNRLSGR